MEDTDIDLKWEDDLRISDDMGSTGSNFKMRIMSIGVSFVPLGRGYTRKIRMS